MPLLPSNSGFRCERCGAGVPTEIVVGFCGAIIVRGKEYLVSDGVLFSYLTCSICAKPLCLDCKTGFPHCGAHPEVERENYLNRMRAAARDRRN